LHYMQSHGNANYAYKIIVITEDEKKIVYGGHALFKPQRD